MRYLSSLLAVALLAGMAGGVAFDGPIVLAVTLAMSASWVAAVLGHRRGHEHLRVAAVCMLAACGGWLLGAHAVDRALNAPIRVLLEQRRGGFALEAVERRSEEPVLIEGRLLADAVVTGDNTVIRVAVQRLWITEAAEVTSGGVSLGVSGAISHQRIGEWKAGRVIRAPALLRRPARYLNHGLPDQERALARRGVSLVGTIKSGALIDIVRKGRWWEEAAASVRARTRSAIGRDVGQYGEQSAAIATAILIGDRAGLSAETERRLQEAGTYHVIAISGGNIAILAGLIAGSLAVLGVHGRLAALAGIFALTSYAVVAAGGPSVLRATVMAIVYLAVRLIDQRTAPINAMALTATAVLIANPLQVVDVGFWFTFGATMALVCAAHLLPRPRSIAAPALQTWWGRQCARLGWALCAVVVGTACVELALAPVAAFVFQRVTLAGLVLNFAALPAMTGVQLGAMAVLGADVLGLTTAGDWFGRGVHLSGTTLVNSARLLDYAPWLTWRIPPPHAGVMLAYYGCLCLTLIGWRVLRPNVTRSVAAAALLLFVWIIAAPDGRVRASGDGRLHVAMLDVGQGDSVLVTFPNGRRLLVDTGGVPVGTFDIGDRVVGPAMRADRLLTLDYLAITHADADHVGGAISLLRDFSPSEIWWGIPVARHAPTEDVRNEASRQRSAWRTLQRDDRLMVGGVEVRLHHPPPEDWERQRVRNNDSLVIELRFDEVSVLLTGDIDHDVEAALAPALDLGSTVVLKVAHHGSLTSSSPSFLRAIRPHVALIGVGRGNPYGHPAPHVIGRLHDVGAEVFRTDLDGQITVVTDGRSVWTRAFTGRAHHVRAAEHSTRHEGHEGHEGK